MCFFNQTVNVKRVVLFIDDTDHFCGASLKSRSVRVENTSSSCCRMFTIVCVLKQRIIVLAIVLGHGLRSRWRTSHIRDHIIKVGQELRIKERQNPFIELARISGGYHIVISPVVRQFPVPIKSIIIDSGTMWPAEIVEAIGTIAIASIFKFARRWCIYQRRLDALDGLMVPHTSRSCRRSLLCRFIGIKVFERAGLIVFDALVMILVAILVAILVQLVCIIGMIRGDAGGEARRGRRPVIILVVVAAVFVIALV